MRVIISAGGTGGHIYPALSIINKIMMEEENSEILYIGTKNRMESKIVPEKGINYIGINIIGIKKDLSIFKALPLFLSSINKCKKIIKEFKPDVVIGVGGYVTAPVIYAAHKLKIKTIIHEQNSIPGKTNRFLTKYVDKILVSLPGSKDLFKHQNVVLTGNPRSEEAYFAKPIDKKELGLNKNKKLVLIVMGSLGSMTVSNSLKEILPKFKNKDYEVLLVTGKDYYDNFKNINISNVKIVPYLNNMINVLKRVDVMVTRAGASTIAEILADKIPSIFIPSPYVANNHQYKNAKELEDNEAAIIIEEKDLNSENLLKNIDLLLENSVLYKKMQENLGKLAVINSSSLIYEEIKKTIGG